jgi:Ras-related protein Rab-5C
VPLLEKYDSLISFYCRNTHVALLVFDVTSKPSFEKLPRYLEMLNRQTESAFKIVVGSKIDMIKEHPQLRTVSIETAKSYAASIGAQYAETSARTGEGIDGVFDTIGTHFFGPQEKRPELANSNNSTRPSSSSSSIRRSASGNGGTTSTSGESSPSIRTNSSNHIKLMVDNNKKNNNDDEFVTYQDNSNSTGGCRC